MKEEPKRLTPTKETLIRLFAKSGNQCAFEGCTHNLFNEQGVFIAEVCHIEAALKGGERFNEKMDNEQRREESNLILLCKEHHKVTDNEIEYPPKRLQEIKKKHENKFIGRRDLVLNDENYQSFKTIFEKQNAIYELLFQLKHLFPLNTYLNSENGKLEPSKELVRKNLFYFLPDEQKQLNVCFKNLKSTEKTILITGHPSSGKTCFAINLAKKLQQEGFQNYYLKLNSGTDETAIKNDIAIIKDKKSIIIIDDVHKNLALGVELFKYVAQFPSISIIFISRLLSSELQGVGEEYFNLFEIIQHQVNLSLKNIPQKFEGIIKTYIKQNAIKSPAGDISKVVKFCNSNILKLYLLLETWKESENELLLSDISHNHFTKYLKNKYTSFRNPVDEEYLLECAAVYSFGIDFHFLGDLTSQKEIAGNGLIVKTSEESQLYEFWHTKFAELLIQCILEKPGIDRKRISENLDAFKQKKLFSYLDRFNSGDFFSFQFPNNMIEIIASLSQQKNRRLIIEILSNDKYFHLLTKYLESEKPPPAIYKELIKHLRFNSPRHLEIILEKYIANINFVNQLLADRNGFDILSYILISSYKCGLSKTSAKIASCFSEPQLKLLVNNAQFNSLTLSTRLLKNYFPALSVKILNCLSIEEWKEKINPLPLFILSNSLTEIKAIDPILANKIFTSLDERKLQNEIHKADFYRVEKILNEFKEIDSSKAERLYSSFDDKTFLKSLGKASATQIGKGLVALKILNAEKTVSALNHLSSDVILEKLYQEKIRNAFRIISELDKVDKQKTEVIITEYLNNDVIKRATDITDIFTLIHNLEIVNYSRKQDVYDTLDQSKIKQLLNSASLQNYASGLAALKEINPLIAKKFFKETFASININKLPLTAFGPLLLKLRNIDFAIAKNLYRNIPVSVFVKKAVSNDITYSQVVKALDELRNIDKDYTSEIFEAISKENGFKSKAYRLNIDLLLHSIDAIYKINPKASAETFNSYKENHKNSLAKQNIDFLKTCSGLNKFNKLTPKVALQLTDLFKPKLKLLTKGLQFKELTTGLSDLANVSPVNAKEILRSISFEELYKKALIVEKQHIGSAMGELRKVDKEWYFDLKERMANPQV